MSLPVSNCSLGELQSSAAASDVFALALPLSVRGKNQACSFSGLGELQVWPLRRPTSGGGNPYKNVRGIAALSITRPGFVHCLS